eukprot:scaffold24938_cov115-Skeletonema_dohrnii-CCMP3373.AAC.2
MAETTSHVVSDYLDSSADKSVERLSKEEKKRRKKWKKRRKKKRRRIHDIFSQLGYNYRVNNRVNNRTNAARRWSNIDEARQQLEEGLFDLSTDDDDDE